MRVYYSVELIEFITKPMGNAIPAGPVINTSRSGAQNVSRKQINPHAHTATERNSKERKEKREEGRMGECERDSERRTKEKREN